MIRNAPTKNYYDEVLKLVPQGSASGSIASFDDGAADCPLKSLVVEIEPIQSGSGTPSPSNVRAISARSEVSVTRAGKNLLPPQTLSGTRNGVTIVSNNGVYTLSGTSTAVVMFVSANNITLQAGSYVLNSNGGILGAVAVQLRSVDGLTMYASSANSGAAFTLTEATEVRFRVFVWSGNTIDVTLKPQLEVGSTATDYEPYQGDTYTISLGQSIYGGTLDVGKGELVIDKAYVDLSGITASGSKDSNLWRIESSSPMYPTDNAYKVGFCDKLVFKQSYEAVNENDGSIAFARSNGTLIILRNDAITAAADAVDYVKALQVVYPITNPTTVTLTPTEIRTLYGINNLWNDSGSVSVTYKANATLLYEKIRNAIIAQGGQI